LSSRMENMFAARIRHLPKVPRNVLTLAALDGTTDLNAARRVVGERWLKDIEPAERAGLVRFESGRFAFRHPLTRSAVVSIASSEERRERPQTRAHELVA